MPWLAFRQAPLAGVLRLEWPSRQAPLPLAGALSPRLGYFVLEWLQRNHGGPWRSPGKPCRGVLRLPVHKFGILGYPYSSTPTLMGHKCTPVISDLLIYALEFWCLFFLDKPIQVFLPPPE